MPRRRVVAKREVLPDPKFGNPILAKFMNHVMISGKKSVAESIVYGALDLVEERTKRDPIEVFDEALENIAPMVEVKSRRVGGATYQVPVEVRPSRRVALSSLRSPHLHPSRCCCGLGPGRPYPQSPNTTRCSIRRSR